MIKSITKSVLILCGCIILPLSTIPCTTQSFERKFWGNVWVSGVWVPWTAEDQEDNLLHTIRVAINRVLSILAFISLVLCLYAWFQMMTSGGDSKKYSAWFSILKNAGIWLAIIWVSWLIVSLVFYIINWSIQLKWW